MDNGEGSMTSEPELTVSVHNTGITSDTGIMTLGGEIISSPVAVTVMQGSDLSSFVVVDIPSSTEEAEKGLS